MPLGPAEVAHGPMFIGFVVNVFLYGIMITQVYLYFTTFKQDKLWMKLFVIFLLLADTVNTLFDLMYLYRSLIIHFGNAEYLATADWLFATDPAITGIIASSVQLFFAWRVRVLTRSWILASIVFFGALAGLAGAVATSFEVGSTPQFIDFRNFKGVVIMWLASESISDIIITVILVWYLVSAHHIRHLPRRALIWWQRESNSTKRDFENQISWLTALYETGLITSVAATLDLILFLTFPTGLHLIFNFPLCKLYTNSLMSSLNSRAGWRYGSSRATTTEVQSPTLGGSQPIMHSFGMGAIDVPAPCMVSTSVPVTAQPEVWPTHRRRFSTGTRHMRQSSMSGNAPGRAIGAGLVASLSRTGSALFHAPPEVYVHVDPCRRQDEEQSTMLFSNPSEPTGGLGIARTLSVCLSVASDADSKKASMMSEEEKDSSSSMVKADGG